MRSIMVCTVNACGSNPPLISFQSNGVETDGIRYGLTEYAAAKVSASSFWLGSMKSFVPFS